MILLDLKQGKRFGTDHVDSVHRLYRRIWNGKWTDHIFDYNQKTWLIRNVTNRKLR